MSSIDDRIVNMQFNNSQFQQGIAETNASLERLQSNLKLNGAGDGFDLAQSAADRFSLASIGTALESISSKFSIFGVSAFTIIQDLAQKAIGFGSQIGHALTDPIIKGGEARALALQKAQFQFRGLGLDVTATMLAAKNSVLDTAFSLDQAATAAGQLGASGITAGNGLESSLRGIAGLAAQTGASYDSIAQIFSKVAGNGRLMGQDLLQLSANGVNAAAVLAKSMGLPEARIREMVTDGKISFKQFSDAMGVAFGDNAKKANELFTGALSNMKAALARLGAEFEGPKLFNMRDIFNAMSPLINKVHDALMPLINDFNTIQNSGAAAVVDAINKSLGPRLVFAIQNVVIIIQRLGKAISGGFGEIFPPSTVSQLTTIGIFIQKLTQALIPTQTETELLRRSFAGFFAIIDIGGQLLHALFSAIFDILGVTTQGAGGILVFSANLGDFLVKVDNAIRKGEVFSRIFGVIATVIKVPIMALKIFIGVIKDFVGELATIKTDGPRKFAEEFRDRFTPLINLFGAVGKAFSTLAAFISAKYKEIFSGARKASTDAKSSGANPVVAFFNAIGEGIKGIKFSDVLDALNVGFFGAITVATIVFIQKAKGLIGSITGLFSSVSTAGGITSGITGLMKTLGDSISTTFGAIQKNLRADTLIKIAAAIAIMTASIVILSLVDSVRLASSLGAIVVMTTVLSLAMKILSGPAFNPKTAGQVAIAAASMILLAIALDILSIAVAVLAKLELGSLASAVGAIIVILAALVGTVKLLGSENPGKLAATAAALIILSVALNGMVKAVVALSKVPLLQLVQGVTAMIVILGALIATTYLLSKDPIRLLIAAKAISTMALSMLLLSQAVKVFGELGLEKVAIGIGAVTVLMGELVIAVALLGGKDKDTLVAIAGIIAFAAALFIMANAVAILANLGLVKLALGIGAISLLLIAMVVAANSLEGSLAGLGAMIIAAGAIMILALALQVVATMSWDDIGRTMVALAGALLILAAAMFLMGLPPVLLGSIGILAAAVALAILAPALKILSTITWDQIGQGLGILAATLGILAGMGILLIPALPGLVGLGFAILLLGAGALAAGIGVTLLAGGLALLVVSGQAGITLFSMAIDAFIAKIPALATGFGAGLVALAQVIGDNAPKLIDAFVKVLNAMLDAVDQIVPHLIEVATDIIVSLVEALVILVPLLVNAGLIIIEALLTGIANHIGEIATQGYNVMINFLNALAEKIPDIIIAAGGVVLSFIKGMGDYVINNADKFVTAGSKLFRAIIDGIALAIKRGGKDLEYAGRTIGDALIQGARNALHINSPSKVFRDDIMGAVFEGIEDGNDVHISRASAVGEGIGSTLGNSAINSMKDTLSGLSEAMDLAAIDSTPTIKPVLDLTNIQNGSKQIPGLLKSPSLSLDASSDVARSVSLQEQARNAQMVLDATRAPANGNGDLTFIQNNNSPKALSTIELYRQTNNQLSVLKGDLGVVDQGGSS